MDEQKADLKHAYYTHSHINAKSASKCAQLIIEVYPSVLFGEENLTYWTFPPDE